MTQEVMNTEKQEKNLVVFKRAAIAALAVIATVTLAVVLTTGGTTSTTPAGSSTKTAADNSMDALYGQRVARAGRLQEILPPLARASSVDCSNIPEALRRGR